MALTKQDLDKIDERTEARLNDFEERLGDAIDEKLTKLKSEFFNRIDPILKEVVTSRQERPLMENRIEKLEKIHPSGKHQLAS